MADSIIEPNLEQTPPLSPPEKPPVGMELRNDTVSPEDLALQDAEAALEREGQQGDDLGKEPPAEPPEGSLEQPPQPEAAPAAGARKPVMVPIERLNEALRDRDKFRDSAIFLEGRIAAITEGSAKPADGAAPVQPEPAAAPQGPMTVEQLKRDVQAGRQAIQQQYDDAKLNSEEYARKLGELDALLIDGVAAIVQQAASQAEPLTDKVAQDMHAEKLENEHPYLQVIQTGGRMDALVAIVDAEWKALGLHGNFKNRTQKNMAFREAVAKLADAKGPEWFPDAQVQKAPATTQPAAGALSPQAAARKQKLEMAASLPPNVSDFGKPGQAPTQMTEAQILAMPAHELERLDPRLYAHLLQ